MKGFCSAISLVLLLSCVSAKDRNFTASTPAGAVVKTFLGIPLSDSVDFIRWKLVINDLKFSLDCNYGIGKPNTNGFIGGGKTISFSGNVKRENNYFRLVHDNKSLQLLELNNDLFHIVNTDKSLLVGNGGWSYALNNESPISSKELSIHSSPIVLKDSMAFEGRTPCRNLDDIRPECYKRKWYIVLYADPVTKQPTHFSMNGMRYQSASGTKGSWKIRKEKDGRVIYELYNGKDNKPLYLLKLDDNILFFTDPKGNLLVGDHDFSYVLNRRW